MSRRTEKIMLVYGPAELRALNRHDVIPARPVTVRKSIFSLRLWQPARQRSHSQHRLNSVTKPRQPFCTRPSAGTAAGLSFGCVNACSVGNKAKTLCRTIVDEQLDVFVITETWHERCGSSELRPVTPLGYMCVDAARPIQPNADNICIVGLLEHNHTHLN